jgi:hypothetical protein
MTLPQLGGLTALCVLALALPHGLAEGPIIPNDLSAPVIDPSRPPIVPLRILALPALPTPSIPSSRVRLFRMQPGFLSDVTWLDDDRTSGGTKPLDFDPEPEFFSLSAGNDNPLFDFRSKGDPGGVGYSRVNSQLQLFDTSKTAMCLGLQAVTPTGLANDGLADNRGTTVVTPGFSLFHELDEGLGVQAFVSKNLPLLNHTGVPMTGSGSLQRDMQYGVAIQRSVTNNPADPLSNLYMSLGALGQQHAESDGGRTINWDVMPGMHLRLADNWWLSGGVLLPVGPNRDVTGGHWRLTCQWQF